MYFFDLTSELHYDLVHQKLLQMVFRSKTKRNKVGIRTSYISIKKKIEGHFDPKARLAAHIYKNSTAYRFRKYVHFTFLIPNFDHSLTAHIYRNSTAYRFRKYILHF